MRWPFIGKAEDDTSFTWCEWALMPLYVLVVVVALGLLAVVSIPFFMLYPDLHAREYDFGTEKQQKVVERYRRLTARVSLRRRIGRVLRLSCRKRTNRPPRRALRRTKGC